MLPRVLPDLPHILIVEPDGMLRGSIAAVCREMQVARASQASSVSMAMRLLGASGVDMLLVSVSPGDEAFEMLELLRSGNWPEISNVPVALTASEVSEEVVARAMDFSPHRVLVRPFRIRDVIETIVSMGHRRQSSLV